MRIKKVKKVPMSKVIPDSRDASKDYWIPTTEAVRLYSEGKLDKDLTNSGQYTVYCPVVKK